MRSPSGRDLLPINLLFPGSTSDPVVSNDSQTYVHKLSHPLDIHSIVYCVWNGMQQPNRKLSLLISGTLVALSVCKFFTYSPWPFVVDDSNNSKVGCIAVTARAASTPGLLSDFAGHSSYSTAVVVISWLSLLLSMHRLLAS